MGWRFRRSTKIGPFRITSSKSGTSFSFGGKGYRVTRQANGKIRKTYSIPGTGISYSETSPSKKQRKQQKQLRTIPTYRNSRDKYNFGYEQSATPRPRKHTARWVFSVLFLLIGATHLASAPISGILFLAAGFVLNPVIAPNINLHGALPTVLAVLLVIAGTIAFPSDPASEVKDSTRAGADGSTGQEVSSTDPTLVIEPEESVTSQAIFEVGVQAFDSTESGDALDSDLESWLETSFGSDYVLDYHYYDVYHHSEDTVYIAVFPAGSSACVDDVRSGDLDRSEQWLSFVNEIIQSSSAISAKYNRSCLIDVSSDLNHHTSFIRALDGELIYDNVSE